MQLIFTCCQCCSSSVLVVTQFSSTVLSGTEDCARLCSGACWTLLDVINPLLRPLTFHLEVLDNLESRFFLIQCSQQQISYILGAF